MPGTPPPGGSETVLEQAAVELCASPSCAICGTPLRGRRPDARCCSGRCRIVLCRRKRHEALLEGLVSCEQALRAAADAVAALRVVAEIGPHITDGFKVVRGGR